MFVVNIKYYNWSSLAKDVVDNTILLDLTLNVLTTYKKQSKTYYKIV